MGVNILGMMGLGDNIYQRSFIKSMKGDIYLHTPFPEIYSDLKNVKFVKPRTILRTQNKNIKSTSYNFTLPKGSYNKIVKYGKSGICNGMRVSTGEIQSEMDLPDFKSDFNFNNYIIIRPVTLRKEWLAESRSPDYKYVNMISEIAKERGYTVISIADIDCENEFHVGDLPYSDVSFNHGELSISDIFSLTKNSKLIAGGIGWIVPLGYAQKINTIAVCGGYGAYNSPEKLEPMTGDKSHVNFLKPDNMCMCSDMKHNCNKTISSAREKINRIFDKVDNL